MAIVSTLAVVGLVAPLGSTRLSGAPSFLPAVIAVIACLDVLSAVLLLAQFRDTGNRRDLALSWAYSWSLVVMLGYALAFPGVFGSSPPLGAAASTAPWLWVSWHAGFPGLLGLAAAPWPARFRNPCPLQRRRAVARWTTAVAVASATVLVAYDGLFGSHLPVLISGLDTSRMAQLCAAPMMFCVLGGTYLVARGFGHASGPERWALVACVAVFGDVFLTLISRYRFSLGWYTGRLLTVAAAGVVFIAMLGEIKTIKRQAERDRVEAIRARREAEAATAAKSAFLSTMSHEIRTPISAVIGMTDLLLDTQLSGEQRTFAETVRLSGDALLVVINDVLDFSKIESGGLELEEVPFDLTECLEGSLDLVALPATTRGLELVSRIDADCPQVLVGDPARLRQILTNLLSNAVKFTSSGAVELAASVQRQGDQSVRLLVAVSDTGVGIPAEGMDRLFRSFSQVDASISRNYGGTGLGLAISRMLAEQMGGDLGVHSEVGVGSTFHLSVLLRPRPGAAHVPPIPPGLAGRSALVVDDNATSRRSLRAQVEAWGMVARESALPDEALERVRGGACYDIAIVDMTMPGMTGLVLAAALRKCPAGRHLPVILLTDLGWRPPRTTEPSIAGYLTKPVKTNGLRDAVSSALGLAPPLSTPYQRNSGAGGDDRQLRVLLAEDNATNQYVGRMMLTKLGHRVDVVGNGREALHAVLRADFDVVLMDMHMPEMDGLEATRRIRAELLAGSQPAIIAMTANVSLEDRLACTRAGMDGYLAKPVRALELRAALRDIPRRHPATDFEDVPAG